MALPYRIILVASILIGIMRYFMVAQWNLSHHISSFLFRTVVLWFLWWMLIQINKYFNIKLPFSTGIFKRLFIQIITTLLICFPVLLLVDYVTKVFYPPLPFINDHFKGQVVVLFIVVVAFIDFVFYGDYFFRQWKQSVEDKAALQVQAAEAERTKSLVQYRHLKNQVNPHFLFNTLSSLDGLILSDPSLASTFVRHLAKVYRYVLEHSENEIVTLEAEIDFIKNYISILKVRYGNAIKVEINISQEAMEKRIATVTLQMLIDNAIKHNIVDVNAPLVIEIKDKDNLLSISNNKQLRKQIDLSTKKGLSHLQQLYTYLSATAAEIIDTNDFFEVNLPLL